MGKLRNELGGEALWGLPHNISEELINAHDITLFRWLGHWMFMIVMCAGFAVGGFWIFPYLERLNARRAIEKGNEINALLIHVDTGFGILVALFVWIFLTLNVCLLLIRWLPMPLKGALFFGISQEKSVPTTERDVDELMKHSDRPRNASELINRWAEPGIKKFSKILYPIAVITAFLSYQETKVFSLYSESGFYQSGYFSESFTKWNQVSSIELGCNHVTGKNQSDDLVYKINFKQGASPRMEDAVALQGTWLESAAEINNILKDYSVNFKRWKWLDRNPLHPKCLSAQKESLTRDEFQQVVDLLQIGHFPGDSKADIAAAKYSVGKYEIAIDAYNDAINEMPNDVDSKVLAKLYFDRAEAKYSLAFNMPGNDEVFYDAFLDYSKAIELHPKDSFFYRARGSVLAMLGDYKSAFSDFETMSSLEGNEKYWSMIRTGGLYRQLGDYDKAMQAFGKVSRKWEPTMPVNYHMAKTYNKFGYYEEALKAIETGLLAQDNYGAAYHTMACSNAMLGHFDEALADYKLGARLIEDATGSHVKHFPGIQHNIKLHKKNEAILEKHLENAATLSQEEAKSLCFSTWWDIHYQTVREKSALLD